MNQQTLLGVGLQRNQREFAEAVKNMMVTDIVGKTIADFRQADGCIALVFQDDTVAYFKPYDDYGKLDIALLDTLDLWELQSMDLLNQRLQCYEDEKQLLLDQKAKLNRKEQYLKLKKEFENE